MQELILVCEDLFGLEVLNFTDYVNFCLASRGLPARWRVIGFVSDCPDPFRGVKAPAARLGTIESHKAVPGALYLLGLKLPAEKRAAVQRVRARGGRFASVLSEEFVLRDLTVGEGCVLDCHPKPGARFGDFVTVMRSMVPQVSVGDYTTSMRFANVTGDVGRDVYIGDHAYVHHGCTVGDGATLETGAVSVKNVKAGARVAGVPAKRVKTGE